MDLHLYQNACNRIRFWQTYRLRLTKNVYELQNITFLFTYKLKSCPHFLFDFNLKFDYADLIRGIFITCNTQLKPQTCVLMPDNESMANIATQCL